MGYFLNIVEMFLNVLENPHVFPLIWLIRPQDCAGLIVVSLTLLLGFLHLLGSFYGSLGTSASSTWKEVYQHNCAGVQGP